MHKNAIDPRPNMFDSSNIIDWNDWNMENMPSNLWSLLVILLLGPNKKHGSNRWDGFFRLSDQTEECPQNSLVHLVL